MGSCEAPSARASFAALAAGQSRARRNPSDGAQVQPVQEGLDRQVPVEVEEEADSPPAAQAAQDAAKIEVVA